MMKRSILLSMIGLSVLLAAAPTWADDLFPPTWRGRTRSVHAGWDSWNGFPNPMAPDIYGYDGISAGFSTKPCRAIAATGVTKGTHGGRSVLTVLGDDDLIFQVPNFCDDPAQPEPDKLVRIQVTYWYSPDCYDPQVEMLFNVWAYLTDGGSPMPDWNGRLVNAGLVGRVFTRVEEVDGWRTDAYEFTIEPNPRWEKIGLKFRRTGESGPYEIGGEVAQVVIDTICPEPISLVLLALGGLALSRRKR